MMHVVEIFAHGTRASLDFIFNAMVAGDLALQGAMAWQAAMVLTWLSLIHYIIHYIIDHYMTNCEYYWEWNCYLRSHILVFTCSRHNCQSHCMLHNQLWHHQRLTIVTLSPEWKRAEWRTVSMCEFFLSFIGSSCCIGNKMKLMLFWWTVYALTLGLFRCLFPTWEVASETAEINPKIMLINSLLLQPIQYSLYSAVQL